MTLTVGSPAMIDTNEIDTLGEELASVSLECGLASAEASSARVITAPPNPSPRWSTAGSRIDGAAEQLAAAADEAAAISRALGASASLYLETESSVAGLFSLASSATGAVGGILFGHMVVPLVGATAVLAAPGVLASTISPQVRQGFSRAAATLGSRVTAWLGDHPGVARNPLALFLVRGLVSGSDDTIKSALGMPPGASLLANDPRLTVAGAAAGLGALGVPGLRESAVTVTPGARTAVPAPRSVADLATRIPSSTPGSPQIRVEEYQNGDSWIVYVGGTVDMGLGGGDEAFDMESNVALMADADGAGYRSVTQAMSDAGIGADDSVTIVGHSQGGLIAERVAQSDDYTVQTLVTFGAPSTGADLPDGVNAYAIEHSDDLVPALGGFTDGGERIVVTGDAPAGGDEFMSAHSMDGYEQTASQIDDSLDPRFGPLHQTLDEIDGSGTSTDYQADRIEEPTPPSADSDAPEGGSTAEPGPHGAVRPQDADLSMDSADTGDSPGSSSDGGGTGGRLDVDPDDRGDGEGAPADGTDDDGGQLRETASAHRRTLDRFSPQPSPLPLPDEVIHY